MAFLVPFSIRLSCLFPVFFSSPFPLFLFITYWNCSYLNHQKAKPTWIKFFKMKWQDCSASMRSELETNVGSRLSSSCIIVCPYNLWDPHCAIKVKEKWSMHCLGKSRIFVLSQAFHAKQPKCVLQESGLLYMIVEYPWFHLKDFQMQKYFTHRTWLHGSIMFEHFCPC